MSASFEQHRAEEHVSVESYVRLRRISLGRDILQRERVYLDVNYWIRLRDVVLGRRADPELVTILTLLRDSVKRGHRICPISETTFLELLKQQDDQTRLATAELIDELSQGVSLCPLPERMATELARFIYATLGHDVMALNSLPWTKLSYVLGVAHPFTNGLDEPEQRIVQKAFFDHMWDLPLTEMVQRLGFDRTQKGEFAAIAEQLHRLNTMHASSMNSYERVYEDEFIGGLELLSETGQQVLERIGIESGTLVHAPSATDREQGRQNLFRLLRVIFEQRRDSIVQACPSLHVGAVCHAATRWNQTKRINGNDLFDFHHAQAALPYCDLFLTEAPLHTLLRQRRGHIDKYFRCKVISSQQEAANHLQIPPEAA